MGNTQDYNNLRTGACREFYQQSLGAVATVNQQDSNIVSTAFTSNLIGLLKTAQNLPDPHPAAEELNDISSEKTTGRFYSYVTLTSDQFFAIATSVLAGDFSNVPVPASSTIVFEVDSSNKVSAWFNDESFALAGCGDFTCGVDTYTRELQKTVVYTDLNTTCQGSQLVQ